MVLFSSNYPTHQREENKLRSCNLVKYSKALNKGRSRVLRIKKNLLIKNVLLDWDVKKENHNLSGERSPGRKIGQVTKSAGRMPWHQSSMKDVISCDKLRGVAHTLWSADFRMGKPAWAKHSCSLKWIHSFKWRDGANWNISVASGREIKRDSESSGERNRKRPNRKTSVFRGCGLHTSF